MRGEKRREEKGGEEMPTSLSLRECQEVFFFFMNTRCYPSCTFPFLD